MTDRPRDRRSSGGSEPDVCSGCHVERCVTCHACRCNRGADWVCRLTRCPAVDRERVKHSGPETKFCVLCLSGEHERVDDVEQP